MASAGIVNIHRDVDDKFYHYHMPLLLLFTKIEGKGNGIKTIVPNMVDVARTLSRHPTYPTKFFGCELRAQTSSDDKNGRYIANGAHDASCLRELLDVFINKFILCHSCRSRQAHNRDQACSSRLVGWPSWVEECKGEAGISAVQIYQKAQEFGVEKKHKTVLVLVQALFTEEVAKEIDMYKALLAKMVTSEKHQKALLGGIKRLVRLTHPKLIPSIPKILMALYQINVLEEDMVTLWGTHVSKK
ncbi:hypothetical protein CY34DRAFT_98230 [Suillus luteus UH-Slu-Lm8-n1]|uniref:W2 domain-containing protein n=1 Tax=Suillus luteus UH-Slu-Lm8-n1 TaxID=930992 RepID=A0A0D0AJ83_9AGAM|nr:hypothetical protein CY34DRAFT_98230 [Suillus luteus UH-Slu-Lm8-n1]